MSGVPALSLASLPFLRPFGYFVSRSPSPRRVQPPGLWRPPWPSQAPCLSAGLRERGDGMGLPDAPGQLSAGGRSQAPPTPAPVLTVPADSLPSQIREYGLVHLFSSALAPHSTTFILRCKIRTETTGSALLIDFSQSEGPGHFLVFTLRTWMAES